VPEGKSDILQGTLDLMVLKTLDAMGPLHVYGIARRIERLSEEALPVNQGTIYLCLVRLGAEGLPKPGTERVSVIGKRLQLVMRLSESIPLRGRACWSRSMNGSGFSPICR
jgi:DNA-binding PadR family transcriptional regulator